MELKVSSAKRVFSPFDCDRDPAEKEISEEDDDDRNHKHRRREAHSQSVETEAFEPVLSRPYRKRNNPFDNGHPYREGDSHSSEGRFEKRRGMGSLSRAPLDSYQRMRLNQSMSGNAGPGGGRGRESGAWGQHDSRFSPVDIASQLGPQGPVTPGLFTGRGSAFGMVPGIPNGGLDTLHSLGLQGPLRTSLHPTISMGIPRQRCRDFEERGFCLRGDMCPMEHGVNRIVVEDVQSLSQFNLPVSLPSAHMLGQATAQGSLPAIGPSSSMASRKALHSKSKPPIIDDGLGFADTFGGGSVAGAADFYDPDQPLWSNDHPETSAALLSINPSNIDDTGPLLDADSSGHDQVGLCEGFNLERPVRGDRADSGSKSIRGRISSSNNRLEVKEKVDCTGNASSYDETKKDLESFSSLQGVSRLGKQTNVDTIDPQMMDSSSKPQSSFGRNMRKPSQKALRTLFVRGVPPKDNKPEALLSHFQKFGEVVDIYIPVNSERAFVQFSKREEAEAALKAPDAVMGNRFIKLFWANRDSIMNDGVSGGSNLPLTPTGVTPSPVPPHPTVACKGKVDLQATAPKPAKHVSVAPLTTSHLPKLVAQNGPKATPPLQKKLESLEHLKEELRKKQEMLDQKRNEFRRQLDKIEKQAVGVKHESMSDQVVKKQKGGGTFVNPAKVEYSSSSEANKIVSSPQAEATPDSSRSKEDAEHSCSKSSSTVATQDLSSLKQSIRPLAPLGPPFIVNRYKLDNRPTAFKILPPLPSGLANVVILKEHFSIFGGLPSVELENLEPQDSNNNGSELQKVSARISFPSRQSAERAFLNGKCWQGQTLQFMWLQPRNLSKDIGVSESITPSSKQLSDANSQSIAEDFQTGRQEGTENQERGESDADGLTVD